MSSRELDVRFAKNTGQWRVEFWGEIGGKAEKGLVISAASEDKRVGDVNYTSKNTVSFRASTSSVLIEEKRFPVARPGYKFVNTATNFVGAKVSLDRDDMRMIRNCPMIFDDGKGGKITGHIIEWKIRPGRVVDLNSGLAKTRNLQPQLLTLCQPSTDMPAMNMFKLLVRDVSAITVEDFAARIIAITGGTLERPLKDAAEEWGKRQFAALNAEHDTADNTQDELRREGVVVRISSPGQYPQWTGQIIYSFVAPRAGDIWGLMIGGKIRLDANTIFIANRATKDAEDVEAWTATIVSAGDELLAIANNSTSSDQKNNMYGQTVMNVTITAIDEDPLRDRMYMAIKNAMDAFAYERGDLSAADVADKPRCRLRVPLSASCLDHPDLKLDGSSYAPLELNGPFDWDPEWEMLETNKEFIKKVIQGAGGKAHLWGPPGTGKTTLLAKTAGFALKYIKLEGKIVLSAHSNAATHVLLEACIKEFPKFCLVPEDEICWHETKGARGRRLNPVLGREVSSRLEAYSSSQKMYTFAAAEPVKYAVYLRYRDRMEALKDAEAAERKKYYAQIEMLRNLVKEKCRVFICTISTCSSKFFGKSAIPKAKPWRCDILILDELSQCHTPAYLEARQVYNPRRVIEAGDPFQLKPYTMTDTAKIVWSDSPIARAVKMGDRPLVMLKDEFRMPNELYHGTSCTHYEGKVLQHPSIAGKFEQVFGALKKIAIDPMGDGKWYNISSRFLWLDLDAPMARYRTSCVNFHEGVVVERFVRAASYAGISWSDMCHLVCYEGAYQQGLNMRKAIGAPNLAIRKVDSMQGGEQSVVVASLTRNNHEDGTCNMGFMDSPSRQNVMTSRQQAAFIMIGSMRAARTSKIWTTYIDHITDGYKDSQHQWCFRISKACRFRVNGSLFDGDNSPRVDAREVGPRVGGYAPTQSFTRPGPSALPAGPQSHPAPRVGGSAPTQQQQTTTAPRVGGSAPTQNKTSSTTAASAYNIDDASFVKRMAELNKAAELDAQQQKIKANYEEFRSAPPRQGQDIMTDQEVLAAAVDHGEYDYFDHDDFDDLFSGDNDGGARVPVVSMPPMQKTAAELAEEEEARRIEAEDDARYKAEQAAAAEKERVRVAAEAEIAKQIADLQAKLEELRGGK